MKTLFKNAVIITANEENEWFPKGYLVMEGARITAVGAGDYEHEAACEQVIDLDGKWISPGWINTHGHAGMTLLRGFADDLPLQEWLETKMWPMEAKFDADIIYWATSLAVVEMLNPEPLAFWTCMIICMW